MCRVIPRDASILAAERDKKALVMGVGQEIPPQRLPLQKEPCRLWCFPIPTAESLPRRPPLSQGSQGKGIPCVFR
jgi:hypothetical protein